MRTLCIFVSHVTKRKRHCFTDGPQNGEKNTRAAVRSSWVAWGRRVPRLACARADQTAARSQSRAAAGECVCERCACVRVCVVCQSRGELKSQRVKRERRGLSKCCFVRAPRAAPAGSSFQSVATAAVVPFSAPFLFFFSFCGHPRPARPHHHQIIRSRSTSDVEERASGRVKNQNPPPSPPPLLP